MSELSDGLAAGKMRIFQVNGRKEEPHTIFEYYLEYGDEGVVAIWIEGRALYVPIYALMPFVDHFRSELESK